MDRPEAIERLSNIVKVWTMAIAGYPPEVAAAQTTMMVMRGPDIEAIKLALAALQSPHPEG